MKAQDMKAPKTILAATLLSLVALDASADAARTFRTSDKWNTSGNISISTWSTDAWIDDQGGFVTLANYNDGKTQCVLNGLPHNVGISDAHKLYGLTVDQTAGVTSEKCYVDGAGTFQFAEGGVRVLSGNLWVSKTSYDPKVYLAANQTWSGGDTKLTHFGVGAGQGDGTKATLFPVTRLTSRLTIEKNLAVWLYSPSNNFAGVDVTVRYPARLVLPDVNDARLRASTLTLEGDGEALPLAKSFGYSDWSGYDPTTVAFLDADHIADALVLKDGADLRPGAPTVFDLPSVTATGAAGSKSEIAGPLVFSREQTAIAVDDGVTLSISGDNAVAPGVTASLTVTGAGTLELSPGLNGTVNLDETSKLVLLGNGKHAAVIAGGFSLEVRASGVAMLGSCDLGGYTGAYIDVTAGVMELGAMADLPPAVKLRTSGEGKVVFGSSDGLDPSRIEGTKNYVVDTSTITDRIRTEKSITVGEGEILHVRGSGLTAATELIVDGGTVCFEVDGATIGSPVSVTAGSWIRTAAESIVGTISGAVTAEVARSTGPTNYLWVVGPGCVVFAGGGAFTGAKSGLRVEENASVKLTHGDYTFTECELILETHGTTTSNPRGSSGKYIGVVDGGNLKVLKGTKTEMCGLQVNALDDGSSYFKESLFEVGSGCTVELGSRVHAWLGSRQALGRICVSGGTLKIGGYVYLGWTDMGTGVIEVNGGTLELSDSLRRLDVMSANYQTQGRIDLSNATVKVSSAFPKSEKYLIRNLYSDRDNLKKRLRVWTRISGACTLDLTDLSAARTEPLANVPAEFDRAEWFGTGTLTVKGGKTFVMNSVADGVGLRLADDGTSVILPENAQVFDCATCEATKNVIPYKDQYSTTNTCLRDLSLPTLSVAGLGVSLHNERADRTVSVGQVLAEAGGCFDTADTLCGAGAYEVTNLTFAENAIFGTRSDAPTLAIGGTVSFPSALGLYVRKGVSGGGSLCALRAATGIEGDPLWTPVDGSLRSRTVRLVPTAGEVWIDASGLMLLVR